MLKNERLAEKPAPVIEWCSFDSEIMKVTENLLYISEIVSSGFLFCQTSVGPALFVFLGGACCPHAPLWSTPAPLWIWACGHTSRLPEGLHPSPDALIKQGRLFSPQTSTLFPWTGMAFWLCFLWVQGLLPLGLLHCVINVVKL